MTQITLGFFDEATGTLTLDAEQPLAAAARADLARALGPVTEMGCANPVKIEQFPRSYVTAGQTVRVSGYWHNSLVDGPGRRSVVRFQGCPIKCVGCWVPETHDEKAGRLVNVATIVDTLLSSDAGRDGVTILGGEAFAQPSELALLVDALRERDPDVHILVYSGYTLKRLHDMADNNIEHVLNTVDVLIDGPYIAALADGAGPWTGSGNQKVHYLR